MLMGFMIVSMKNGTAYPRTFQSSENKSVPVVLIQCQFTKITERITFYMGSGELFPIHQSLIPEFAPKAPIYHD